MPTRVAIIKKQVTNADREGGREEEPHSLFRNISICSSYGNQYGHSSKKLKTEILYDPAILL